MSSSDKKIFRSFVRAPKGTISADFSLNCYLQGQCCNAVGNMWHRTKQTRAVYTSTENKLQLWRKADFYFKDSG
jgi:hypothetical protein